MNLPFIPSPWMVALKAIPEWVYVGAGASVVLLGGYAYAVHQGAEKQASRDAPVIAQVPVLAGQATLTYKVQEDASARHAQENTIQARGEVHEGAVRGGGDDGGYRALTEWLCDTDGVQPGCAPQGR